MVATGLNRSNVIVVTNKFIDTGSLYCFGSNRHGQLGFGQSGSSINEVVATPSEISILSDKKIVYVASKSYFSLVMTGMHRSIKLHSY